MDEKNFVVWGHGGSSATILRDAENATGSDLKQARDLGARCGLDADGLHVEDWVVVVAADPDEIDRQTRFDRAVLGYSELEAGR